MKKYLFFFIVCFGTHHLTAQPTISSFAPASGPIGATVIITGTNFNTTTTNNVVFFGSVQAIVSAATATSLTVTVPLGTTYDPITVTTINNNLTAYSRQPFLVTFLGAASAFIASSFEEHVEFPTGLSPVSISNTDLDKDGKPDFVVPKSSSNTFAFLKNNGISGTLSYAAPADIITALNPSGVSSGDINADGKPDIVITNQSSNTVSVYKNTSTTGNISFDPRIDFATGTNPEGISIGDIDADGKPDLVICDVSSSTVSVLRNTGSAGSISFAAKLSFATGSHPNAVIIRDLDGDGKPDLGISVNGANKIAIFRNTSVPGTISFAPGIDLATGTQPNNLAVGDLDGDGSPDLAAPNTGSGNVSVFRNQSSPGVISFAAGIVYTVADFPQKIAIGDLNGDGKPDMAITHSSGTEQAVAVLKNLSSAGALSFAPKFDYALAANPTAITIGDFDADKFPDIAAVASGDHAVSILRNAIGCSTPGVNTQPADMMVCVGTNASFSVTTSFAFAFKWQVNDGTGWNDVINSGNYSDATTTTLNITNVLLSQNNYKFRCVANNFCGAVFSAPALLTVTTALAPSLNITATAVNICPASPVTFTATTVNGGSSPIFQWKKNFINVGVNADTYTDNTLNSGDVINCVVTSNTACPATNSATSNSIVMIVSPPVTPSVSISASSNNICFGTAVTFTAVPVNGGTTPSFQWVKNGANVGTNNAVFTDNSLNNGDVIKCVLSSGLVCITASAVTSNQVLMSVTPAVNASVTISASADNICAGTLITFTAIPINGGTAPIFQWKKNGLNVGTNSLTYTDNNIANGDMINCVLTSNLIVACLSAATVTSNMLTMSLKRLPGNTNLGSDKTGCNGDTVKLNVQPGYQSYLWQDNSANSTFNATGPGSYNLKATDSCGNVSFDTVLVSFKPKPSGFLPPDSSVCYYQPILLKPVTGFNHYLWINNAITPAITIYAPGLYWLEVIDSNNCKGRDSITIVPENCMKDFYIPTAFTPNEDGTNDFFKPILFGRVKKYEFKVYNRNGNMIFHTKTPGTGWNGTVNAGSLDPGVYVWTCIYQMEGQPVNMKKGTVILLKL